MRTDNILEFLPVGDIPTKEKGWNGLITLNLIAIPIWALLIRARPVGNPDASWFFLAFMLIVVDINIMLFAKTTVKLTLDKSKGILSYDYLDFWGREKNLVIYLKTAYYKYKYNLSRGPSNMRLLIYNNYFKNQLVIKAAKNNGLTREQLDAIVENIKEIQAKLKGTSINQ